MEFDNRSPANCCRMEYVRIVRRNGLRFGFSLKRRNFLPEMVQHRIRRRVPIVRPTMHFAAGNHVDPRDFLFEDGRLGRPQLRIREIAGCQLAGGNKPVHRLIPPRDAVRADNGRRVFWIVRHARSSCDALTGTSLAAGIL